MTEVHAEIKQFPLRLGPSAADTSTSSVPELLSEDDARAMPPVEVELIRRMSANGLSTRYFDCYRELRRRGYHTKKAAVVAWKAAGYGGRAHMTGETFARLLGISRRTLVRQLQQPDVCAIAMAMQMEWLKDRVPSIDEALYDKASKGDVTAMKLYYSRARVAMSGEDAEPQDAWMQALEQARKDAEQV